MPAEIGLVIFLASLGFLPGGAAEPPGYVKEIKPFVAKYCLSCHGPTKTDGALSLETVQHMLDGGKSGPALVPGKPVDSLAVQLLEGRNNPKMPPRDYKHQPAPGEAALFAAWVAAGAADDSPGAARLTLANVKPSAMVEPAVAALAFHPKGEVLAVGGRQEVILVETATGDVVDRIPGQLDKVTALAFSKNGQRLAVASSAPGRAGDVRIYFFPPSGIPGKRPDFLLRAHKDAIHDLAWSPDGKLLATCGYDRLVKLWDLTDERVERGSSTPRHVLKDHSDAVYGVAFSPDGRLLASAAADRAVKVWEVSSGKRLYTLGEATDWVYTVAWHPDGKRLAAAGVDRSIRVWEANATGGKLLNSVFGHEQPITRLVYSGDGQLLFSLGEDRLVKAWDASQLVEKKVFARQPDAVLALAVHPQHKQLALGRHDGAVLLIDTATSKVVSQPLPVKPKPPVLTRLSPASGPRGKPVRLTLEGRYLDSVTEVVVGFPGAKAAIVAGSSQPPGKKLQVDLSFPPTAPAGPVAIRAKNAAGESEARQFLLDLFDVAAEIEPNDSPTGGMATTLPVTIHGRIEKAGDVDYYRFTARAGQEIGAQVVNAPGSKLAPVLELTDAAGRVLAEDDGGLLGHRCAADGLYTIGIRDREYRGEKGMDYRLHLGDIPIVTSVFPLGLERGTKATIHLDGVHLGDNRTVVVEAPPDASPGSKRPVVLNTPVGQSLGGKQVVIGEFPEVVLAPMRMDQGSAPVSSRRLAVPGTANGEIGKEGETHSWRFQAKKNERLIVEVHARRLGSPLDSYIEILDAKGQLLPRATLRSLARTNVTFRDHDSVGANIRLETWNELAVNDYLYVGGELMRIKSLPTHPDADCIFFSAGGQRTGFLDTTPTHHPQNEPMYKVSIHPPGTVFPANGFPVFQIPYRNDDGGPGYGKDSRLFLDPPEDGEYQVRIGDVEGRGGPAYAYRLTIRSPQPDFRVSFTPTAPAVWKGGAQPITVTTERIDGFQGAIDLRLEGLPAGFSAPATTIPNEETSTAFALFADASAKLPEKPGPLRLIARAKVNGKEIVHEVKGEAPRLADNPDIVATTEQTEIVVQPGKETRLTVTIERKNGFAGRVPIDVKGLPHGVRVLDIGLNGILITEKETRRTMEIYAEPWVEPMEHPIVVLARREGKNSEFGARSVLLKIQAAPGRRAEAR